MRGGHPDVGDGVRVVIEYFSSLVKEFATIFFSPVEEFVKEVNLDGPEQGQAVTHP